MPAKVPAGIACRVASAVVMERPATPAGPIGLILPTFAQEPAATDAANGSRTTDPLAELAGVSRAAEKAGAGAIWACDHLFWHGPTLESLTALTVAAGATEHASLGTCILQLPLRRPAAVAKQVATLQVLSRGRFVLGVGVGSHPHEYDRAGIDYASRGHALDAGIAEVRRCWSSAGETSTTGDALASAGGHGGRPSYLQLPEPPAVPVWIGGSSDRARKRAARLGDGWMPLFVDPDRYRDDLDQLAKEVAEAGRDPGAVTSAMVLFVSVDDDPVVALRRGSRWMSSMYALPAKAFERHLVSGTPAEVADMIATYRAYGAEHVVLYVTDDRPLPQFSRVIAALSATGAPAGR